MPRMWRAPIPFMRCAMNKSIPALLIALLASGCATAVPQALPPNEQPKQFVGPVQAEGTVWPDMQWWEGFGDPDLAALAQKAASGNRDIAQAAARVKAAEAQSTIQRSALFPQVGGEALHTN